MTSHLTSADPPLPRPASAIAIVGIDGAGKTTQARLLAEWLTAHGHPADYWRNAGGRLWFGRLAHRLGRDDAEALFGVGGTLAVESLLRWLAIGRALGRSRISRRTAVMDRYSWCQFASIRARSGRRERLARRMYRVYPAPDLTVFLAVDPERARTRIDARGEDSETIGYLSAADAAYRSLPESAGFVVIDGNRTPGEVQRDLRRVVSERLPALGGTRQPRMAVPRQRQPDEQGRRGDPRNPHRRLRSAPHAPIVGG